MLRLKVLPLGFMDRLPLTFQFQGGQRICKACMALRLGYQLSITLPAATVEDAAGESFGDGASLFAVVRAVAETAVGGDGGDVFKRAVHTIFVCPKLKFAHPRRVYERTALGERDEFAMGGGVPATAVGFADVVGAEVFCTEETVDDRGFAGA